MRAVVWLAAGLLVAGHSAQAAPYYVATNGSDSALGTTWAEAVRTISNAVAKATTAGDVVWVSNGTHWITAPISITNAITLRSLNGRTATTIRRQGPANHRLINCSNAGATIQGFTLRDGNVTPLSLHGGAISMSGGLVHDCLIVSNAAASAASCGGGGIHATGASIISNCFFTANSGGHYGGAIYLAGAGPVVTHCIVSNNIAWIWGGGIYQAGGTVRDTLITRNQISGNHPSYGGGGIRLAGGSVINCTIAGNITPDQTVGAGIRKDAGTVTNSIIYHNRRGTFADDITTASGVVRSCAPELTSGPGNLTADPDFISASTYDYRLLPTSPCIDAGTNASISAVDLAGNPRPTDGDGTDGARADMGAFETDAYNSGPLRCAFTGTPRGGLGSVNTIFTARIAGADTNLAVYAWDFNNDGVTNLIGPSCRMATNLYASPGTYDVRLVVTNAAGDRASLTRSQYIQVAASPVYVATNGSHTPPYDTWAKAATNLATVLTIQTDGLQVLVSNGTFVAAGILLNQGVTIRGVNGPNATIFRSPGGNTRLFQLTHTNAVLDGLTIRGGNITSQSGGGVHLNRGTVQNCVIVSNRAPTDVFGGGGIWADGPSRIVNCVFRENYTAHYGGAVRLSHAQAILEQCIVTNNSAAYFAGGIYINNGIVRNTLVSRNRLLGNNASYGGGGMFIAAGRIENCTIADNWVGDLTPGGGVRVDGGTITNSIIYHNLKGTLVNNLSSITGVRWSCAPELTSGTGNITADPEFANHTANDYRLWPGSLCIDAGATLVAITNDLAGSVRPIDGNGDTILSHDMGAYEAGALTDAPFRCNFQASERQGASPLSVVFTAAIAGPDTNGTVYRWDFDNNGTTDPPGIIDYPVVTNTYASPGLYSIRLIASNATAGAVERIKTDHVLVFANELFVSLAGSHTPPFTNWATASTNLAAVLPYGADGVTVWVTNGNHVTPMLQIANAMTIRSVNGPLLTRIRKIGGSGQIFDVLNGGATIRGFTLTGGVAANSNGGAVRLLNGGYLLDCILTNNTANSSGYGGGAVYLGGPGVISNCLIAANSGYHYGSVFLNHSLAMLRDCIITNNLASIFGAGVYAPAGTIRNCLIAGNRITASHSTYGGGAMSLGAGTRVENCTIVNNRSTGDSAPGGVWMGGSMTNCIIFYNYRNGVQDNFRAASLAAVNYSCAPDLASGIGNLTAAPLFADTNRHHYVLIQGSPGIDAGTNQAWITESTLDLAGKPRIVSRRVDMGAYEYQGVAGSLFMIR